MRSATHTEKRPAPPVEGDALGPRLQQILQQSIAPWKRESLGDEDAQIAEVRRRPVRHRYDAEEAKRRLGLKPPKRTRTSSSTTTKSAAR